MCSKTDISILKNTGNYLINGHTYKYAYYMDCRKIYNKGSVLQPNTIVTQYKQLVHSAVLPDHEQWMTHKSCMSVIMKSNQYQHIPYDVTTTENKIENTIMRYLIRLCYAINNWFPTFIH